jgi:hypothetical protein
MTRTKLTVVTGAALAAVLALTAAQQPSALGQAMPGLWEISGAPGSKAAVKQCFADVRALARFEHRGQNCSGKVISDSASSTVVQYSCGGAGFGRSKVDMITPRSLRIETQGISQQLPFNYVIQARRVGDCQPTMASQRH